MTVLEHAALPETVKVRRGDSLLRARELGIAIAIVIVFGLTTLKNSNFAGALSIQELLTGSSLFALLAVGETLVIITRNVDLSVGSVVGLSAYLVGDYYVHNPNGNLVVAFGIGIGVGLVIGAINGAVTTFFRVPSLVVTLAALYIVRGVVAVVANAKQIDPSAIPDNFQSIGYKNFLGIPRLAILVIVIVAIASYAMKSYRSARDIYAIGSNPEAAELAGVPVAKRVFTAFVISGGLAGLAGALFLAENATVNTTGGTGFELQVVAAVVVGGVAIFGGSGTVFGAALGALLLHTINQALVTVKISAFWNDAIAGALLLAAIAFDRWLGLRVARRLRTGGGAHGS